MGFFKRDNKPQMKKFKSYSEQPSDSPPELPELPKLPEFNLPQEEIQTENQIQPPNLPSFPNSNFGEKMSQSTIKEAVNPRIEQEEEFQESYPQFQRQMIKPPMYNLPEQNFQKRMPQKNISKKSMTREISDWPQQNFQQTPQKTEKRIKRSEPLFIQLDKYEKTISTFDEIKLKISEIENLLKSVREVKMKEDEKINHWENEIESIKAQLDEIDQDIFNQV
jgi:hypothetical protein